MKYSNQFYTIRVRPQGQNSLDKDTCLDNNPFSFDNPKISDPFGVIDWFCLLKAAAHLAAASYPMLLFFQPAALFRLKQLSHFTPGGCDNKNDG